MIVDLVNYMAKLWIEHVCLNTNHTPCDRWAGVVNGGPPKGPTYAPQPCFHRTRAMPVMA